MDRGGLTTPRATGKGKRPIATRRPRLHADAEAPPARASDDDNDNEGDTMIGKTIYIHDGNRRKYEDDDGNKTSSTNRRYHYRPIEIVSENRVSWIGKNGEKVNKKTGEMSGGGQFGLARKVKWSWEEVEAEIEREALARRMARQHWDGLTLDQLRRIAAILDEAVPDA